ncbi:MAG: 1-acyl-sn-glycerol-3-phosphate acyltransferase [Bacteroidetes bacterium]|nr:1-acyl-sn-glycerol-3-phosphate acyltransferase [Bacteroidota bacterium]MBS1628461.1 1-acyl-sn-glycerol-3-phosphate acyltransferase [Bacteroidota bacterium]
MDAFLLACFLRRRVQFFARGDAFHHPLAERWLRSLGIMPVYRKTEGAENMYRNGESHNEALEIFKNGGVLLIFCEGSSDIQKRLKPLKKGPFRLAIEAYEQLEVSPIIVPLGINYTAPVSAGGYVYLELGTTLEPGQFFIEKTEAGKAKAATRLMRSVEEAIRNLVWHVPKVSDLETANDALNCLPLLNESISFLQTQEIINAINSGNPDRQAVLQSLIQKLQKNHQHGPDYLLLILTFPLAVVGFLYHVIPLSTASYITKRNVQAEDFLAPVFLCCSLLLLFLWYLLSFVCLFLWAPAWFWLLIPFLAAACGIFWIKKFKPLLLLHRSTDTAISRLEALKTQ